MAQGVTVVNFICQVQMKILKGNGGGLIFRAGSSGAQYRLRVGPDGSYDLASQSATVAKGTSPAINQGLNQINTIKVVARGANISLYVNGQLIASVTDSSSSSGRIGLMGVNFGNAADVAYSTIKVWQL